MLLGISEMHASDAVHSTPTVTRLFDLHTRHRVLPWLMDSAGQAQVYAKGSLCLQAVLLAKLGCVVSFRHAMLIWQPSFVTYRSTCFFGPAASEAACWTNVDVRTGVQFDVRCGMCKNASAIC